MSTPAPVHELDDTEQMRTVDTKEFKHPADQKWLETNAMPEVLAGLSEDELLQLGRSATRKNDLWILPMFIVLYILNYLDRQNISAAKLAGIEADLGLKPIQYQLVISLLFVGYILFQTPSNMVAAKVAWPATYICFATGLWGAISAATGAVHSFGALMACRFTLGIVEAAFFPGALYFLSLFYTKRQFALRTSLLYSGSQLGNAFGNLFAIAILELDGSHGIAGWRWLFICEGIGTTVIAGLFALLLPNSPYQFKWYTDKERAYKVWELAREQGAADDRSTSSWQGFKMVVSDPKTYLLMGVLHFAYTAAGVVQFFPSVVNTLGFSRNITYVLTAPPYLLTVVVMIINGYYSDKRGQRFWHIVAPFAVGVVANIIAVSSLNTGARYLSMMLMPTSIYAGSIVVLSWITQSMTQPAVKRAIAISFINQWCNTPNVWTSFLYFGAPRYTVAFIVNLISMVVAILFACATRWYLKRKNAELDRGDNSARGGPSDEQLAAGFRYLI